MKTIKQIILVLLLFPNVMVSAQQFWLTTNEFWGGPKTGITISNDSVILVSTMNSVLRSTDECYSLETVLNAKPISTVFSAQAGLILAGGKGKIYYSEDNGSNWDSVAINSTFPVTQFVENINGELFAITGIEDEGDGVFYSGDKGRTWEQRNNGLGAYLGCRKIAIDRNNRLYLAVSDFYESWYGGFYFSENNGISWEKISITSDSLANPVKVGIPYNLSVLPNDSVYISFKGISYNAFLSLNLYKSIDEIKSNSSWNVMKFRESNNWWEDTPINSIHQSQNGDWYSSLNGAIHQGGTCFSHNGKSWEILDYGLGTDTMNARNEQHFVETSNGRIFMIQYMDERIYKTDTSIVTSTPKPIEVNPNFNIYPNPIRKGESFTLEMDKYNDAPEISVYEISGKKLFYTRAYNTKINIPAPVKEGIYIVSVRKGYSEKALKIVVN
ncbi:T9SS type A sorting domain-containing protein [Maribellus comscasis]|uniref:T9SS type A sorting domain-containing protein n=1 Tax=Maribellus comscasis TaxID=2681766 RepID=A0A6I6JTU6_9BACT|nr:T9SS type A sorting domain-containing protein [Maribellus comscasis]QGY46515.1 T9SS type A sorting domain-containing protein [Maribellus comscasis]